MYLEKLSGRLLAKEPKKIILADKEASQLS